MRSLPAGADGKAAAAAVASISKACPLAAVCVLAADGAPGTDAARLLAANAVPAAAVAAGVLAKDWMAAVMAACGGKGGGRDDSAAGTSKEVEALGAAADAAAAWIAGKKW